MSPSPRSRAASAAAEDWRPSGVVTLLTDFGVEDAYVGVMKGVIASAGGADLRVIDLTHAVAPQDVRGAAFHLAHAWRYFPAGTVHTCVCDPGVGTERAILVAVAGGHAFVAPDNGLLGPVLDAEPRAWIGRLDVDRVALPDRSRTFHGRDVFAPAAARLAGGTAPGELATAVDDCERVELPLPKWLDGGGMLATVVSVDRFGNLIGNVPAEDVAEGSWTAVVGERRAALHGTYGETAAGELIALVDSYGLVELAVNGGSAADALGLGVGDSFRLERSA